RGPPRSGPLSPPPFPLARPARRRGGHRAGGGALLLPVLRIPMSTLGHSASGGEPRWKRTSDNAADRHPPPSPHAGAAVWLWPRSSSCSAWALPPRREPPPLSAAAPPRSTT